MDDTLADAHFALGRIKQNEWDWAGAERAYKRAIELSPSLVLAHVEYAQFLSTMQRHAEASSEIKRAQELDPFSIRLRLHEARLLHLARRSDEALKVTLELLKKAQPTAGNYYGLGFIYEGNGMYEEAVTAFRQAISIGGETTGGFCYLANALALAGKRREALEIVDRLNRTPEYVSPTELARVYTLLNDKEAALKLLERAYAERDLQLQTLNIDLHLDNLRSDPRFQDLVKRVGLP